MQYSIYINQPKALEWGLNLQQAALFSFCYELPSWADEKVINGACYYWISKSYLTKKMPILTDKPDTIKRLLRQLSNFGLIDRQVIDKTRLYVRVTDKGRGWNEHNDSNLEVGKKIPRGREKNPRVGGEKNPPNTNTINTNTINTNVSDETLDECWSELRKLWKISNSPVGNKRDALKLLSKINLTNTATRNKIITEAEKHTKAVKQINLTKPDLNLPNVSTWLSQKRYEQEVTDFYSLVNLPKGQNTPPGSAHPPARNIKKL